MADLIFADSHNMVAYLEKSEDNADFVEIVDFLNASPIRQGKDFSRTVTPLFATMLIQSQAVEGEGSGQPTDETIHEERGDSVERAATTATSLDAEQGSVNKLGSGEDSMKLTKLMELYTKLSERVLDLENIKTAQCLGDQEDSSKQERNEIDQDEGISWFQEDAETQGRYGHDISTSEVTIASVPSDMDVSAASPIRPVYDSITDDITLAKTLMKIKSNSSIDKGKGIMQEPEKPVKVKGKDKIKYDADVAQRLQAELDKEAGLEREREEESSNAALIKE
ncbi:hypothetical protein Tco_0454934 [Tanacetum coccineum]